MHRGVVIYIRAETLLEAIEYARNPSRPHVHGPLRMVEGPCTTDTANNSTEDPAPSDDEPGDSTPETVSS
jgi:hypothetical protein